MKAPTFTIPQSDENTDWIKANKRAKRVDIQASRDVDRMLRDENDKKGSGNKGNANA